MIAFPPFPLIVSTLRLEVGSVHCEASPEIPFTLWNWLRPPGNVVGVSREERNCLGTRPSVASVQCSGAAVATFGFRPNEAQCLRSFETRPLASTHAQYRRGGPPE